MMIKPNKFTDLNNCLISIAAGILSFLKNRSVVKLSDLDLHFSKTIPIESDEYKYAFDLLYAMGCIDYGKQVTVHPDYEDKVGNAILTKTSVAVDDNLITGQGLGSTIPFALAVVDKLVGKEMAEKIAIAICYQ